VISLDFELNWGVFDNPWVESYKCNLLNVRPAITRMLELADKYKISLTFSTVGFLFAETKEELLQYLPSNKPNYNNKLLSPYPLLDSIGNSESEDPIHYAKSIIMDLKKNKKHEIGTHTFSHYYCHEKGQTIDQFEDDIKSAIAIAKNMDIEVESIVFPRNMVNIKNESDRKHLDICYKHGILSFRGNEKLFDLNTPFLKSRFGLLIQKVLRFSDSYFNISGYNTYKLHNIKKENGIVNIPASKMLRAFSKTLRLIEPLKRRRIKNAMNYAAKKGELFHLWWHPHNFGADANENFNTLESIFKMYAKLNKDYNFQSMTMTELTQSINNKV